MTKNYFTNRVGKWYWDFDWLRFDLERRFNPPIPVHVILYIGIGIKRFNLLERAFCINFDMLNFNQDEIKYRSRVHLKIPLPNKNLNIKTYG